MSQKYSVYNCTVKLERPEVIVMTNYHSIQEIGVFPALNSWYADLLSENTVAIFKIKYHAPKTETVEGSGC